MNIAPFLKQVALLGGLPLSRESQGQVSRDLPSSLPLWQKGHCHLLSGGSCSACVAETGWGCQFPLSDLVEWGQEAKPLQFYCCLSPLQPQMTGLTQRRPP